MRVALVHDYFASLGGSEAVVLALRQLFPEAPLYTLFADKRHLNGGVLDEVEGRTSFLQRMPGIEDRYWLYYPLFPRAVESLDLREYDLVISSSHGWVKNVRTAPGSLHICYCHTPLRYAWERVDPGLAMTGLARPITGALMAYVRRWDRKATQRVNVFVANSLEVQSRLQRYYGRSAEVVYPPIDTEYFLPGDAQGDYFLVVSRLVPYKRVDLAVQAFAEMRLPLKVVGDGRAIGELQKLAGPTVEFLGRQPRERLRDLYSRCRALVLAGKEDLGMTSLEAQAAGRPVIAHGAGGALETVVPGETGVHFAPQTVEALIKSVRDFQGMVWDTDRIRRNALRYDQSVFLREMDLIVREHCADTRGADVVPAESVAREA